VDVEAWYLRALVLNGFMDKKQYEQGGWFCKPI
jgi:hypothetical protein